MKKQICFKLFVVLFIAFLSIMGKSCDDGPDGPTDPGKGMCSDGLCVYLKEYYETNYGSTLHLEPEVTSTADIVEVEWDFGGLPVRDIQYNSNKPYPLNLLYPTLTGVGPYYGGEYTISLTVKNSNGASVIVYAKIIIIFCGYNC